MADARTQPDNEALFPNEVQAEPMQPFVGFPVIRIPDRQEAARRLINNLLNETDDLTTYVLIKQFEDVLKYAIEFQKDKAIKALEGKSDSILGAKVETKRSVTWDYGEDTVLENLASQIKELQDKQKKRKQLLGALETMQVDPTTGETMTPAKKVEDGLTISVTLPK